MPCRGAPHQLEEPRCSGSSSAELSLPIKRLVVVDICNGCSSTRYKNNNNHHNHNHNHNHRTPEPEPPQPPQPTTSTTTTTASNSTTSTSTSSAMILCGGFLCVYSSQNLRPLITALFFLLLFFLLFSLDFSVFSSFFSLFFFWRPPNQQGEGEGAKQSLISLII